MRRPALRRGGAGLALALCLAGLGAAVAASLMSGAVPLSLAEVVTAIASPADASLRDASILWSVRIPRTLLAMLVGASLGVSGAVMQGLFRLSLIHI